MLVSMNARRSIVLGLWLAGAGCGALESDEAQQAARVTKETVARGVEGAREQIDRIDFEGMGRAWDAAAEAMRRDDSASSGSGAVDPLAVPEGAIDCEEQGRSCTVTAAYAAHARQYGSALAKQVRVHPVEVPVRGIRIDAIDSGSLGEHFGLLPGDVVTEVNGVALGSLRDTMMLYLNIRAARQFVVNYRRGDEDRTLHVEVV